MIAFFRCLNLNIQRKKVALIELKLHWNYLVIVPDTEYNYEVQYLILVSIKTVDNVEGALWLATQSPTILHYSPPSKARGICAWEYCNRCRNKWVEIIFFAFLLHWFTIYQNSCSPQCRWLAVDREHAASWPVVNYPTLGTCTSTSLNIC